jgi:hypothetical protein
MMRLGKEQILQSFIITQFENCYHSAHFPAKFQVMQNSNSARCYMWEWNVNPYPEER